MVRAADTKLKLPGGLAVEATAHLSVGPRVIIVSHGAKARELTGSAAVVLAWVALEGHADRRRLSATLWPESDPAQARSNLRVLTHRINQRFGSELLVGTEHLELDASLVQVEHDVEGVLAALAAGGAARCELLAEAGLGAAHAGEDLLAWLESARQRLKQAQLAQLGEALTEAFALARHARAMALARACVQLDPLSEHRHRRLMEVLVRAGDRAAALSAYEDCKALLKQHLGVLPGDQTRMVQLRILQQQALGAAQGGQPLPGPDAEEPTTSCAAACHPLVEREAVLAQARAALGQGVHVVVQGEPGVGKTRLLRRLAAMTEGRTEHVTLHAALEQEPFAALAQLLQEVQPRRRPRIGVAEQVELARLAPLAFAEVKPSEAALSAPRLHAALRHWFARLGDAGVRVLVLDDVQYADAASQAAFSSLLESAAETNERAPALLMAHRSAEVQAVLDDAVTQAQAQRRAQRIELPRLTLSGVQALLAAMEAAPRTGAPSALAQHLHKRTGGNPLFVIELARQALEQGEASGTADLQALLGARLQRCSATAQQLAAVAAVAPEHFTVELAAAVSGQSALALMPAWRELEQRGLFAGHGLAHDLIQDAVLAALPEPILRVLHGQVAQYLESQGRQGAAVLRHWTAAEDADRALPHAAHQLYAASAAGLPTMALEHELLQLLERSSDAVLMNNLWLSAEIATSEAALPPSTEVWSRLRTLRHRVEKLAPQGNSASWVAFETARQRFFMEQSIEAAQTILAAAADALPPSGIERAYLDWALAGCAIQLRGDPRVHAKRAKAALAGLPEQISLSRVRKLIDTVAALVLDPVEGIRSQAARRRAGRQRGDMGLVAEATFAMAYIHGGMGSHVRSFRHFCRAAQAQPGTVETDRFQNRFLAGVEALNSGHYALSQRLLAVSEGWSLNAKVPVLLNLMQLRLGDIGRAVSSADNIDLEPVRRDFPVLLVHAHVRAELDQVEGRDPGLGLKRRLEQMLALGMSEPLAGLMTWELQRRTLCASDRLLAGEALLAALRRTCFGDARHIPVLLDVAEARAETEAPGSEQLAAEAARLLRRGCSYLTLYMPEGLARCARLLRESDPREAAALVHVARRWVEHALRHLPSGTEESFTRHVVVNRLLLGGDEQAVYLQPLR